MDVYGMVYKHYLVNTNDIIAMAITHTSLSSEIWNSLFSGSYRKSIHLVQSLSANQMQSLKISVSHTN